MSDDILRAARNAPLIDETALDGLRAALGPATEMLLEKTRATIEDRMARLAALAAAPTSDDVARLAHELGGMSAQVGLKRLSAEALALERCARAGEAAAAAALARALAETARESVEAVGRR